MEILRAHEALNIDDDFMTKLNMGERTKLVNLSKLSDVGLDGKLTLCAKLRRNAYLCEPLGEPKNDPVNARDLAAAIFEDSQPQSIEENRVKFCAWQMMNVSKTMDKLYLTSDTAKEMLTEWGSFASYELLMEHPTRENAVTTSDLHYKQCAINKMWRNSVVLGAKAQCCEDLDETQQAGVSKILDSPSSLLVGMGGCGKSYSVSRIVSSVKAAKKEVVCLAPTHKAKYNIASAVPEDVVVTTIQS